MLTSNAPSSDGRQSDASNRNHLFDGMPCRATPAAHRVHDVARIDRNMDARRPVRPSAVRIVLGAARRRHQDRED